MSRTFKCSNQECNAVNPIRKSVYQSVECLACGTRYAIVRDMQGRRVFAPYYNQQREAAKGE